MTLSGSPVSEIAELSPATSAMTITNTQTTSAIPPPVIAVETRRTSSDLTLYFSGIAISLQQSGPPSHFVSPPSNPKNTSNRDEVPHLYFPSLGAGGTPRDGV